MTDNLTQPESGIRVVAGLEGCPRSAIGTAAEQFLLMGQAADDSPLLMGITVVAPGQATPLIEHDTAELAFVVSGSGWMADGESKWPFEPGYSILIQPHQWHAIRAGEHPVQMLYVFPTRSAPPTRERPRGLPSDPTVERS